MTDFWRRLLAALTNSGPGYNLAATREAALRATFADLAERLELRAVDDEAKARQLHGDDAVEVTSRARVTASAYRTIAQDVRDVLRTGRPPLRLLSKDELEQYRAAEEVAS